VGVLCSWEEVAGKSMCKGMSVQCQKQLFNS
jgi:hypothetical protein